MARGTPPFQVHYTPPHASWLDPAELLCSILTRRLLRRGEFTSCDDLADKIQYFVDVYNRTKTPFRWTYDGRPRTGGRPFTMTPAKVRLAMASMGKPDTRVGELCKELRISRQTLYRHVTPNGEARPDGVRVLSRK